MRTVQIQQLLGLSLLVAAPAAQLLDQFMVPIHTAPADPVEARIR